MDKNKELLNTMAPKMRTENIVPLAAACFTTKNMQIVGGVNMQEFEKKTGSIPK